MKKNQKGFSLIELMISMVISLIVVGAGLVIWMAQNTSTELVGEQSRLEDSTRFVGRALVSNIQQAGYYGCQTRGATLLNNLNASTYSNNFMQAIYGFTGTATGYSPTFSSLTTEGVPTSGAGAPVSGSDILTIRTAAGLMWQNRQSITGTGSPVIDANTKVKSGDYIAISNCSKTTLFQNTSAADCNASGSCTLNHATGVGSPGNNTNDLGGAYDIDSEISLPKTITYFVAASGRCQNNAGGGCPSNSLWKTTGTSTEEVAEGVEAMKIKYIVDVGSTGVGNALLSASDVDANSLWNNVMGVEVEFMMISTKDVLPSPVPYEFPSGTATVTPTDKKLRKIFKVSAMIRNASR